MTPFALSQAWQLFYYPILVWWVYSYVHSPPVIHILYPVLFVGLVFQVWQAQGKSPRWAGNISAVIEALSLIPILLFGDFPSFSLFFSLLPSLSVNKSYGIFWGVFSLVISGASAFLGVFVGGRLSQEWLFLSFSGIFVAVAFFIIAPAVEASKAALKQLSVVDGLGKLFEGMADKQAILRWLVEKAVNIIGTEFGAIYLWDEKLGKLELEAFTGKVFENVKEDLLQLATGTLEWVAKEGKVYVASDLSLDPRYAHYRDEKLCVFSLACVPVGKGKEMKGSFVCGSTVAATFSPSSLDLLALFARYIFLVLEKESWSRVHKNLLRELEALHACCAALTSSLGVEEFLHLLAGFTMQILNAKEWTLFLYNQQKREFVGYLSTTAFMEEIHGLRLTWGEGAVSQAVIRKEALMIPDLSKNPLVSEKENRNGRFLSMLVIPLFKQENVLGAIQVSDTMPGTFSEDGIRFATSLAALACVVLDRPNAPPGVPPA